MDKEVKKQAILDDPYPRFRAKLIADGTATEDALAKIEADIQVEIEEAANAALDAPFPDVAELTTDVYGEVA